MGRVVRASARRLYGQLGVVGRPALAQRMDAAGLVPQELATDFKAYRARLQARLRRCAWTQQNAKTPDRKGEVRGPYVMLAYSCNDKCDLDGYPVPVAGTPVGRVVAALLGVRPAQALCEESKCFVQGLTRPPRRPPCVALGGLPAGAADV